MSSQIKFSGHKISTITFVILVPCTILVILFSQIQISSARTALGDGADSGVAQEQPTPEAIDQVDATNATEYEEQSAPVGLDQVDAASSTTVYLVDNRLLGIPQ
jgi:hypothetical protein